MNINKIFLRFEENAVLLLFGMKQASSQVNIFSKEKIT